MQDFDGLRLCSQIRSLERTRTIPILAIAEADNTARLARGLEIGVNDFLLRPVDRNELLARVRTQIRKRRYTERLRDNVQTSIELAITDGLTGLFNRRYMETHLRTLVEQSAARNKPITVLVLDIDYFKAINDSYGHDAGDDVLREFALRMRKATRNIDLACRYGGEEFVIVMPETDMAVATVVAERLRRRIATEPFAIQQGARHLRSRSRSVSRHSAAATTRPAFSSAPTRRSIAPNATAATAWCRTPPERGSVAFAIQASTVNLPMFPGRSDSPDFPQGKFFLSEAIALSLRQGAATVTRPRRRGSSKDFSYFLNILLITLRNAPGPPRIHWVRGGIGDGGGARAWPSS